MKPNPLTGPRLTELLRKVGFSLRGSTPCGRGQLLRYVLDYGNSEHLVLACDAFISPESVAGKSGRVRAAKFFSHTPDNLKPVAGAPDSFESARSATSGCSITLKDGPVTANGILTAINRLARAFVALHDLRPIETWTPSPGQIARDLERICEDAASLGRRRATRDARRRAAGKPEAETAVRTIRGARPRHSHVFYLDGFYEVTPAQYETYNDIIERACARWGERALADMAVMDVLTFLFLDASGHDPEKPRNTSATKHPGIVALLNRDGLPALGGAIRRDGERGGNQPSPPNDDLRRPTCTQ